MPSPRGERALSQRVHPRWFADGPNTVCDRVKPPIPSGAGAPGRSLPDFTTEPDDQMDTIR